jgi:hypothetical protein
MIGSIIAVLEAYLDVRSQLLTISDYWTEETKQKWVGMLVGSLISLALQEKWSNGYQYFKIPIAGE